MNTADAASLACPLPRVAPIASHPITGHLREMRRNRFEFQLRVGRIGDITPLRIGVFRVTMFSSPELAHEVLVANADSFEKSLGLTLFAKPLLGNGLLTAKRELHRTQRRMIAPLFVQKRIASYADVMVARARESVLRMQSASVVDVMPEIMRTTLEIVGKTLFDAEVGFEASDVGEALTYAMAQMMRSLMSFVPTPPIVPTLGNIRSRLAIRRLNQTIFRLIEERRHKPDERSDLLSLLLAARDEDGKSGMSDAQVRDEAMTIFLAGHETTANAVAWAIYLLSRNPEIRARLEREVDEVLGGRAPAYDDLKSLPYSLQVIKETMRLYPPAYILARRATRPTNVLGQALRRNDIILVNVAGIHRRADLYTDPETFDPDRFTPEREKALRRMAYLPFGAGPRVCIGNHFALMEGQLLLATYVQSLRFDLEDKSEVAADPLITLRPKSALRARVSQRHRA